MIFGQDRESGVLEIQEIIEEMQGGRETMSMEDHGYTKRYDAEGNVEYIKTEGASTVIFNTKHCVKTQEEVDQILANASLIVTRALRRQQTKTNKK